MTAPLLLTYPEDRGSMVPALLTCLDDEWAQSGLDGAARGLPQGVLKIDGGPKRSRSFYEDPDWVKYQFEKACLELSRRTRRIAPNDYRRAA